MTTTETDSLLKKAEERIAELESQLEAWKATAEQFKVSWGNEREAMHQRLEASERGAAALREALLKWKAYFQSNIPKNADEQEAQGDEFTSAWFDTEQALSTDAGKDFVPVKGLEPVIELLEYLQRTGYTAKIDPVLTHLKALVGTKEGKLPVDNEGYMLRRAASGNMNQP